MFNLKQEKTTIWFANEETNFASEVYLTESGEMFGEGKLPATLDGYDKDETTKMWTLTIDGVRLSAFDRESALDMITEWISENPAKAARLFA